MFFDDPNVLIVKEENITPEDLVERYSDVLEITETKEGIQQLLWALLYEAEYMFLRQFYIDQAKECLGILEELEEEYKWLLDVEED